MLVKDAKEAKIQKDKCRFMMLCRVKENSTFRFRYFDDPLLGWIRGDKFEKQNVAKMLQYLISYIRNHSKQYVHMTIVDTTIGQHEEGYIILKVLNGVPRINRLPQYCQLLENYNLPEQLSYEIKPEL